LGIAGYDIAQICCLIDTSGIIIVAPMIYPCPLAAKVNASAVAITYVVCKLVAIINAREKPFGVTMLLSFLTGIIALCAAGTGIA
jgi:hypothetical protein